MWRVHRHIEYEREVNGYRLRIYRNNFRSFFFVRPSIVDRCGGDGGGDGCTNNEWNEVTKNEKYSSMDGEDQMLLLTLEQNYVRKKIHFYSRRVCVFFLFPYIVAEGAWHAPSETPFIRFCNDRLVDRVREHQIRLFRNEFPRITFFVNFANEILPLVPLSKFVVRADLPNLYSNEPFRFDCLFLFIEISIIVMAMVTTQDTNASYITKRKFVGYQCVWRVCECASCERKNPIKSKLNHVCRASNNMERNQRNGKIHCSCDAHTHTHKAHSALPYGIIAVKFHLSPDNAKTFLCCKWKWNSRGKENSTKPVRMGIHLCTGT